MLSIYSSTSDEMVVKRSLLEVLSVLSTEVFKVFEFWDCLPLVCVLLTCPTVWLLNCTFYIEKDITMRTRYYIVGWQRWPD